MSLRTLPQRSEEIPRTPPGIDVPSTPYPALHWQCLQNLPKSAEGELATLVRTTWLDVKRGYCKLKLHLVLKMTLAYLCNISFLFRWQTPQGRGLSFAYITLQNHPFVYCWHCLSNEDGQRGLYHQFILSGSTEGETYNMERGKCIRNCSSSRRAMTWRCITGSFLAVLQG